MFPASGWRAMYPVTTRSAISGRRDGRGAVPLAPAPQHPHPRSVTRRAPTEERRGPAVSAAQAAELGRMGWEVDLRVCRESARPGLRRVDADDPVLGDPGRHDAGGLGG